MARIKPIIWPLDSKEFTIYFSVACEKCLIIRRRRSWRVTIPTGFRSLTTGRRWSPPCNIFSRIVSRVSTSAAVMTSHAGISQTLPGFQAGGTLAGVELCIPFHLVYSQHRAGERLWLRQYWAPQLVRACRNPASGACKLTPDPLASRREMSAISGDGPFAANQVP